MNEMLLLFLQIMLINMILSGDNAMLIAMASQKLSAADRRRAVKWGSLGAVCFRLVLTVAAVSLLKIPYIQALGALLLLYVAVKLLIQEPGNHQVEGASSLREAIRTIIVADIVMSLDNVLAIAAIAHGELLLVIIGIALSIPFIVWGSTMIMRLLDRFPVLLYFGSALLGYTAGEMVLHDRVIGPLIMALSARLHTITPLIGAMIVLSMGLLLPLLARNRQGA